MLTLELRPGARVSHEKDYTSADLELYIGLVVCTNFYIKHSSKRLVCASLCSLRKAQFGDRLNLAKGPLISAVDLS